ncbi:alpha-L-fucosidase [Botrimarina sp.]|uniref:alpha-L-fucosidase n=1 Tax=Botrimarina sp. TaxID=2795802 RepID=UPI0032EB4F07
MTTPPRDRAARRSVVGLAALAATLAAAPARAQLPTGTVPASESRNSDAALEAFRDMALGLFIHWSVDVQYGAVISHSLVGSDDAYQQRFFNELPKTFNPVRYDPSRWLELARACGFRYTMLTVKHHSGFCLWPTETTPFSIAGTPYGEDLVGPFAEACREHNLKLGFYFSPEDFWVLHTQGRPIAREPSHGYTQPSQNPELEKHNERQIAELHDRYGPVDLWFFDGKEPPATLKTMVWDANPDTVVTRGALETPEQTLGDAISDQPWEACFTLGGQWQHRGTNETYKDGGEVIQLLIETRAKGGNLLLNIGPDAYGAIPEPCDALLRELGLWLFVNGEAIYQARPWRVANEGDVWFTRAEDGSAVYLFLTGQGQWPLGDRRQFSLSSVRLSEESELSVLGHGGDVLEYEPDADPGVHAEQDRDTLKLSVMRAQRLYNDRTWPNPIVVKITHPETP